MAMIDTGREVCAKYVRNKDLIHSKLGAIWFPHVPPNLQTEHAKGFFNRLDNQGSVYGLFKTFGITQPNVAQTSPHSINIKTPNGAFNLKEYIDVQEARTEWMAERLPRMLDLVH